MGARGPACLVPVTRKGGPSGIHGRVAGQETVVSASCSSDC